MEKTTPDVVQSEENHFWETKQAKSSHLKSWARKWAETSVMAFL